MRVQRAAISPPVNLGAQAVFTVSSILSRRRRCVKHRGLLGVAGLIYTFEGGLYTSDCRLCPSRRRPLTVRQMGLPGRLSRPSHGRRHAQAIKLFCALASRPLTSLSLTIISATERSAARLIILATRSTHAQVIHREGGASCPGGRATPDIPDPKKDLRTCSTAFLLLTSRLLTCRSKATSLPRRRMSLKPCSSGRHRP